MQFPMNLVLKATGEAATYTAPAGSPVSCFAKRVGGARAERAGSVEFAVEDLTAHVLRSAVTPEAGGVLTIGGQTWTVEAVEPVESDPQALLWALRLIWGIEVEWFTPAPDGSSAYDPPDAALTYTAAAASSGATAITINASGWTSGRICSGDTIAVDGQDYAATADVALSFAAGGYSFADVPLDAGLAGALAGGEAVTITPASAGTTQTVRAAPSEWTQEEILGGVEASDRRLVVRAEAITGQPTTADTVTLDGDDWSVVNVRAVYAGGDVAAWVVQIRR